MEANRVDVRVQEGKLIGTVEENIYGNKYFAFRGIPYAKPPLGELRFKVNTQRFVITNYPHDLPSDQRDNN